MTSSISYVYISGMELAHLALYVHVYKGIGKNPFGKFFTVHALISFFGFMQGGHFGSQGVKPASRPDLFGK